MWQRNGGRTAHDLPAFRNFCHGDLETARLLIDSDADVNANANAGEEKVLWTSAIGCERTGRFSLVARLVRIILEVFIAFHFLHRPNQTRIPKARQHSPALEICVKLPYI
jgi:hypothetical protein